MEKHIRILIIEDSENDTLLIVRHLRKGGFTVEYLRVETEQEMTNALRKQEWDIILSDYSLPGFSGLDAVMIYKGLELEIPFILVSGTVGEHLAVMAMKAGAHDYLMKDRLERLVPAVERELHESQMRRDKKKSEEAYQTLVENSLQGLIVFTADRILFANRIMSEISGYSVAELLSFTQEQVFSIIHTEDRARITKNLHNRLGGKPVPPHSEFRIIHKNGALRWVEIYASLIDYKGVKAVQVAYIDITERKESDEQLRTSEKKFRDIFIFAPVGIYQSTYDGRFIKANDKLASILGYVSAEELMSKNLEKDIYYSADERKRLIQEYEPKSYAFSLEVCWKKKDGSPIWIEMTTHTVKDLSGNTLYFEGFIRDITESMQSRRELHESEIRYRDLFEHSPIPTWEEDFSDVKKYFDELQEQGIRDFRSYIAEHPEDVKKCASMIKIKDVNRKSMEFFNAESKDRLTKELGTLFTDDSWNIFRNEVIALAEGRTVFECEIPTKTFHNGEKIVSLKLTVSPGYETTLSRVLISFFDITERKQAEEALRNSNELLSLFIKYSPIYAFIKEVTPGSSRVLKASENYLDMIGIPGSEMVGKTMEELFPPEFAAKFTADDWEVVSHGEVLKLDEDLNGRNYTTIKFPISLGNKNLLAGYTIDITERKHAEQKLKESEERLKDIIYSMGDWVWEVDENGVYTYSSQKGLDIFGRSNEDIIGKTPFDFMLPEEAKKVAAIFTEIAANKLPIKDLENWNLGKNGERICLLTNGVPILDNAGNLKGYRGVDSDITARKHAEETLRESEEMWRSLVQTSPDYIALHDLEGRYLFLNHYAEGFTEKDIVGKSVYDFIAPENRESFRKKLRDCVKTWRTQKLEYIAYGDEKTLKTYEEYFVPIINKNGETNILSVARDVTERKKSEDALRLSEERFRRIFNDGPLGMITSNPEFYFTSANAAFCEMTGYTEAELQSLTFKDITHESHVTHDQEQIKKLINDEIPYYKTDKYYIRKNKELFWASLTLTVIRDNNGIFQYFLAMIEDIHERKQTVEKLAGSELKYRTLIEHMNEGILQVDNDDRILYVNKQFCGMIGYKQKELIGKVGLETLLFEEDQHIITQKNKARQQGMTERYEIRMKKKNGEVLWVEISAAPVFDDKNMVIGSIGLHTDITKRRRAEEKLESERNLLRTFIEAIPDEVYIKDLKGRFVLVNMATVHGLGKKSISEVIGKTDRDILPAKWADKAEQEERRIMMTGETKINEEGTPNIDPQTGEVKRCLLISKIPLRDRDGKITGIVGINRDIANIRQVEEALIRSEEKYRSLIEDLNDVIFMVDIKGNITYISPAQEEVFGYKESEVLGKKFTDFVYPDDETFILDQMQRTLSGDRHPSEFRLISRSGEVRWVRTSAKLIINKGEIVGISGIISDMTTRKLMEQELVIAKEKAERSDKLKDAFIANMSHEIRTPLNVIMGFSDVIATSLEDRIQPEEIEFFENVARGGERLMRTVEHILNISSIQANTFTTRPETLSLDSLIQKLVHEFYPVAQKKNLVLEYMCTDPTITIIADSYATEQTIINLIDNAIKFTIKGKVSVVLEKKNDDVHVQISDTGIGISEGYLPHLFDSYSQEAIGYTRPYEGLGLGMALIKRYTELNAGSIAVESKKNVGTTFTLTFPFSHRQVQKVKSESEKKQKELSSEKSPEKKRGTILIAEDDEQNLQFTQLLLSKEYDVVGTPDASGAWKIIKSQKVHLILMDLSLSGGIDGIELTKQIRDNKSYAHIPIIALTAHAFPQDRQNSLDAGCNDYLAKPFKREDLRALVKKYF